MREYRGIHKDNGKMVYGWYAKVGSQHFIISFIADVHPVYIEQDKEDGLRVDIIYEVLPETVGQSTGLKDKNGVDLDWWRDDILEFNAILIGGEALKYKGVIKFWRGAFIIATDCAYWSNILLHNLDGNGEYHTHYQKNKYVRFDYKAWGFNKIGNIHDNPELLEQSNE